MFILFEKILVTSSFVDTSLDNLIYFDKVIVNFFIFGLVTLQ